MIRAILLIVSMLVLSPTVSAKPAPAKLSSSLSVLWITNETIGDEKQSTERLPATLENELTSRGFHYVSSQTARQLKATCPPVSGWGETLCDAITPAHADIIIVGSVQSELRQTGASGPGIGAKLTIDYDIYRSDTREKLFGLKQPSYATAENKYDAFEAAGKKVAIPISQRITAVVAAKLRPTKQGNLRVDGLPEQALRDDLMLGIRFKPEVRSIVMKDCQQDTCTYMIDYHNTTWGALINQLASSQGSGLSNAKIENGRASATYSKARAFKLVIAVTEPIDSSGEPLYKEKISELPEQIEKALRQIDVLAVVQLPFRLSSNAQEALAELRKQYGGDLVLISRINAKAGSLILEADIYSTITGRVMSVQIPVDSTDFSMVAADLAGRIGTQLPSKIEQLSKRFAALKRMQYDAWHTQYSH